MAKRRNFFPDFKAKVALAAICGDGTMAELSARYQIHPNMIAKWKRSALDGLKETFSRDPGSAHRDHDEQIKRPSASRSLVPLELRWQT